MKNDLKLIRHMVPFVGTLGWGEGALWRGAEAAGISPEEAQVCMGLSVKKMLEGYLHVIIEDIQDSISVETLKSLPIKDRMTALLMNHFHQAKFHKKTVLKTVRLLLNPLNAPLAWCYSTQIVDALWRQAGDKSTDFNYYTKRLLLAKIYMATLIVWLKDSSDDLRSTQKVLEVQLDTVLKIPTVLNKINSLNPFKGRG